MKPLRSSASRMIRTVGLLACVLVTGVVVAAERPYRALSDDEIGALSERWEALSVDERRALLTEVHHRNLRDGDRPVLRMRSERRFGYRVRRPDGSVVQVERREGMVRYQRAGESQAFGVGFERRNDNPDGDPLLPTAPADGVPADDDAPAPAAPVIEVGTQNPPR